MQLAIASEARDAYSKASAVLVCVSRAFNTTTYLLKKGSTSSDLADTWFFGGLRNEPDERRRNFT